MYNRETMIPIYIMTDHKWNLSYRFNIVKLKQIKLY